jgi:hypothetical protein
MSAAAGEQTIDITSSCEPPRVLCGAHARSSIKHPTRLSEAQEEAPHPVWQYQSDHPDQKLSPRRFPPKVRAEAGVVAPARLILRHQNSGE